MHHVGENTGFFKFKNVKIQFANEHFQMNILIYTLISYLFSWKKKLQQVDSK